MKLTTAKRLAGQAAPCLKENTNYSIQSMIKYCGNANHVAARVTSASRHTHTLAENEYYETSTTSLYELKC